MASSTMLTTSKRILIFSLAYYPVEGGAEIAVKEITRRIPDIEFDMVTMRFDKKHQKFEKIGNVNIYRVGGGFGYLSKILFVPQAALFALRRKYDFYWATMTNMLFPITLMRMAWNRTPYILNLQDGDPFEYVFERFRIRIFKPLLSYGFRHATKVQAISNFLAKWAKDMGYKGEVAVIPNGVDAKKFENQNTKLFGTNVVLITTSRLVEKNAVADIIDALTFLPKNVSLKILGTGELKDELKLKVANQNLANRVTFLGHVPYEEIPKHLHEADIFIRPSLSEGMGNSFIEAMAAGLPVIATPVGGIVDFLKDGETGLFVEPKSPRLIAFQVQKLLSDRVLRHKLIINAKRMVIEKYDWDLIAKEMKTRIFDLPAADR